MIEYESLDYGNYILGDEESIFVENVKYNKSDFNKLYMRRVRLPDGKGNIVYLLSDNFDNALSMITSQNFFVLPSYRRVFYPKFSFGTFMKKRYRFNIMKQKSERDKRIKEKTGKMAYASRVLPKQLTDNIFFVTADLYQCMIPIIQKTGTKRAYTEFYPDFLNIIKGFTPEKTDEGKPNWNNRILIIDTEHFAFNNGAPLKDNRTNPLYLLYLAYLRTRDLSKLNVDIDLLICSKNMFIKFNPSKLTADKWNIFRRFLFRIMKVNLDDYTDNLTEEEKNEIEETTKEMTINKIVDKAIDPLAKNAQPSTKIVLQNAVQTKVRQEAAKKVVINEEKKKAVQDLPKDNGQVSVLSNIPANKELNKKQEDFFKSLGGYSSLTQDT